MQQFYEDVRGKIGSVETLERTSKIYINGIPFVPVKQTVLDDFRKKGEYQEYINAIKSRIGKEVDKIATERKTSFDIEEILGSSQVDIDWQ